jgi:hypothetical protein
MRLFTVIVLAIIAISGCTHPDRRTSVQEDKFKIFFRPAFDGHSEITFAGDNQGRTVDFVLMTRNSGDNPIDTFHTYSQRISKATYDKFFFEVIARTKNAKSSYWEGCCDGMPIFYLHTNGKDSTILSLRSPRKSYDSVGYLITSAAISNMRLFVTDTIVRKYLDVVETYIE